MNKKTLYQQGKTFPPSGHGVGLIFLLMSVFLVYILNDHYWILAFSYISFWILFSRTTIDTSQVSQGILYRRYGFFPLYFNSKILLSDYDAAVIKQVRVSYRTTQSTGFFVLSSQDNSDAYMALQGKLKGKYEFDTLFKGSLEEIKEFIKTNLGEAPLKFYKGIPKAEFEILIEDL